MMDLGSLILEYGLELVLVGLAAILLVGVLKVLFKKQLDKIDKENRKPIYEIASMVFVAIASVVATAIMGGGDVNVYFARIFASYAMMKVMYPLYENFKIRDLVQLIGKLILEKKIKKEEE